MGLFKLRKDKRDESAEVGSVDEWLLSLDADTKATNEAAKGDRSADEPAGAPAEPTTGLSNPPPPQGQPTTGNAPTASKISGADEDVWHLPDFEVDNQSYLSTENGIGSAGHGLNAPEEEASRRAADALPASPNTNSVPSTSESADFEVGDPAGSPMDFFADDFPGSKEGHDLESENAPEQPVNKLASTEWIESPSAHTGDAVLASAPAPATTPSDTFELNTFGQEDPTQATHEVPTGHWDASTSPDANNAELLNLAPLDNQPSPSEDAPSFDLSSYAKTSDISETTTSNRWAPEASSEPDMNSFLNNLHEATPAQDPGAIAGWQPLTPDLNVEAAFPDMASSTGLLETLGAPAAVQLSGEEPQLDSPFGAQAFDSNTLGDTAVDSTAPTTDTSPVKDSAPFSDAVSLGNAVPFESLPTEPFDSEASTTDPTWQFDASVSNADPLASPMPEIPENPWQVDPNGEPAEDRAFELGDVLRSPSLPVSASIQQIPDTLDTEIAQPTYDLSDFGVVLDSDDMSTLSPVVPNGYVLGSDQELGAQTPSITTPSGDEAATLLAILGLDRHAQWDEVSRTHRSLIADHLASGESDPERAQLARSIRREINTAYVALRLLQAT